MEFITGGEGDQNHMLMCLTFCSNFLYAYGYA